MGVAVVFHYLSTAKKSELPPKPVSTAKNIKELIRKMLCLPVLSIIGVCVGGWIIGANMKAK